jgi:hypothetical protein
MSYDHARVELTIVDDSLPPHQTKGLSRRISPSYTEFLNSRWEKKWDTMWNLDYIELKKCDLKERLQYSLVTKHRWPVAGESTALSHLVWKACCLRLGRPLFALLKHDRVISTLFWMPIFIRVRKLKAPPEPAWPQEHTTTD